MRVLAEILAVTIFVAIVYVMFYCVIANTIDEEKIDGWGYTYQQIEAED